MAVTLLALYYLTEVDFTITEGKRTVARQRELFADGKSQTMNSRHLVQPDGWVHAVDLAPWVAGTIPWDDWGYFEKVAEAMKQAADMLGVKITWGGDWTTFKDGPHFQLG
ncbi:MAG: M15 family metallopeptidase [Dehalococcoidales bacterium]|nr:M15 family metallopeptidase [Dehalococcoidales bacterium]